MFYVDIFLSNVKFYFIIFYEAEALKLNTKSTNLLHLRQQASAVVSGGSPDMSALYDRCSAGT